MLHLYYFSHFGTAGYFSMVSFQICFDLPLFFQRIPTIASVQEIEIKSIIARQNNTVQHTFALPLLFRLNEVDAIGWRNGAVPSFATSAAHSGSKMF